MATHKSAIKRHRQSIKKKARNKVKKTLLKNVVKDLRNTKEKSAAEEKIKKVSSTLDKLASKGLIHKNKAANQKSKLTKYVNKLKKQEPAATVKKAE